MPAAVVTLINPDVALAGTVAVICVYESIVKTDAVPLNLQKVAPVNAVPVITTEEPIMPLDGVKLEMLALTVKLDALVPVPEGVVTAIVPVVAPLGTVAVI